MNTTRALRLRRTIRWVVWTPVMVGFLALAVVQVSAALDCCA